jgi:hypothetical protein
VGHDWNEQTLHTCATGFCLHDEGDQVGVLMDGDVEKEDISRGIARLRCADPSYSSPVMIVKSLMKLSHNVAYVQIT